MYDSSSHNGVDTKLIKVPFNFNVDFNGVNANSSVDTSIEIGMQDFVVTSDDSVDIKVDLVFTTSKSKMQRLILLTMLKKMKIDLKIASV